MGDAALQRIVELYNSGRGRAALALVAQHPQREGYLLQKLGGMICRDSGKTDEALSYFENAHRTGEGDGGFYTDYGNLLSSVDRWDEALEHYRRAVELLPQWQIAHYNLANAYRDNSEKALAHYGCSLELDPDFAWSYLNRGQLYRQQQCCDLARADFAKAQSYNETRWEATVAMGDLCQDQQEFENAEACYKEAIELNPQAFQGWHNAAGLMIKQNRLKSAEEHLNRALELNPTNLSSLNLLGNIYLKGKLYAKAVETFKAALAVAPDSPAPYLGLGGVAAHLGEQELSRLQFAKAFELNPSLGIFCAQLMNLNYDSTIAPQEFYRRTLGIRDWLGDIEPVTVDVQPHGKLRLGFLSEDFCSHSCSYFARPLFEKLDRQRCELYLYSTCGIEDAVTEQIKSYADHWRYCANLDDLAIAQKVAADEIDCLIDMGGYTGGNRLGVFARKPAAIQASWLGYPNTTGLEQIDYRISDRSSEPADAQEFHSEKLLFMEPSFLVYRPPTEAPAVAAPELRPFCFGSFNNSLKIGDDVIETWATILRRVPEATLLLKNSACESEFYCQRVAEEFAKRGVDGGRIIFKQQTTGITEHLKTYSEVDLALDSFVYNGTTTTCEALWMGVPTLCFYGDRHAARVSASILTCVGLEEFIGRDVEEYIEKAVSYADRQQELAAQRGSYRQAMAASPLCDEQGFADTFLQQFLELHERSCTGS